MMKTEKEKRRWRIGCCGGATVAVVIVMALLCVILAVTVFKPRNPEMTVNSVKLDRLHIDLDLLEVNVSLDVNVSVKNRNKASFKFGKSTTQLYYHGTNVGEALIPAGKVGAEKTVKMNTTVNIEADRVISDPHLFGDVFSGVVPLSSRTRVSGRVNFLNIFKHHAVASSDCNISIIISNRTIQNQQCFYNVKL